MIKFSFGIVFIYFLVLSAYCISLPIRFLADITSLFSASNYCVQFRTLVVNLPRAISSIFKKLCLSSYKNDCCQSFSFETDRINRMPTSAEEINILWRRLSKLNARRTLFEYVQYFRTLINQLCANRGVSILYSTIQTTVDLQLRRCYSHSQQIVIHVPLSSTCI